jgi:hypothetical protein
VKPIKNELKEQFTLAWNSAATACNAAMRCLLLLLRVVLVGSSNALAVVDEKWLQDNKEAA